MPASARSLRVTDEYRRRLRLLRGRAAVIAGQSWQIDPADLDRTHAAWVERTAPMLAQIQRVGTSLSTAYLGAYLTAELAQPVAPLVTPPAVGVSRHGATLSAALLPSLFTVKAAIGEGRDFSEASRLGRTRAVGVVQEESIAPARQAVADAIRDDDRIIGWRRVTGGGCGACLAAATGAIRADDEVLEVHPHCECSAEPVIRDAPDTVRRDSGHDMFAAMSASEQDALLGPEKAALIRSGDVPLGALVQRDPMVAVADGLAEAPLKSLQ